MDSDKMIAALSTVGCLSPAHNILEAPDAICEQILAISDVSNVTLTATCYWSPAFIETLRRYYYTPLGTNGRKETASRLVRERLTHAENCDPNGRDGSTLCRLASSQYPTWLADGVSEPLTDPIVVHDADHPMVRDAADSDDWRHVTVTIIPLVRPHRSTYPRYQGAQVLTGFLTIHDQQGCELTEWLKPARPLLDVMSARLDEYVRRVLRYKEELSGYDILSPREREVLGYIGNGLTVLEMSQLMGVSQGTLKTVKRRIRDKLDTHSDVKLMRIGMRILDRDACTPDGQQGGTDLAP